jgi:hypothetical protein
MRENFGIENVYIILFSTFFGSVTACRVWGEDAQTFQLNNAFDDSHSGLNFLFFIFYFLFCFYFIF